MLLLSVGVHGRITGFRRYDMTCGECAHCITDEGAPYCVLKPLYTEVALDKECDETNWKGEYYWTLKEEDK